MSIKRLLRTFKVQNYWQRQGLIKYIFVFLFLGVSSGSYLHFAWLAFVLTLLFFIFYFFH